MAHFPSFCCGIFLLFAACLSAQPGTLDNTFGESGKLTTAFAAGDDSGQAVAVQPDGKIVVAGYAENGSQNVFAVARYWPDGTPDSTFSGDGRQTTSFSGGDQYAYAVALQSDGKIVVAGYATINNEFDFAVARYKTNGTLDNTFSSDGKVTTNIGGFFDKAYAVAIQPDGSIVVGGNLGENTNSDFALVRYHTNGTLDATFSNGGIATFSIGSSYDEVHSVGLQPDGKIVAAGFTNNGTDYDFAVARFAVDGTPDATFNGTGKQSTPIGSAGDYGQSVVIQSDGGIVVAGYTAITSLQYGFALLRYLPTGSLDASFGNAGIVITSVSSSFDEALAVTLQPDGKIVAGGYATGSGSSDFAVVRYLPNGLPDIDFGVMGATITDFSGGADRITALTIAPDGKIVAAGRSNNGTDLDFAAARYISGLLVKALDFSTLKTPVFIAPNPVHDQTVLTYNLEKETFVSLALYDFSGRQVQSFWEKTPREAGLHKEVLTFGKNISAGNYVLVLIDNQGNKQGIKVVRE